MDASTCLNYESFNKEESGLIWFYLHDSEHLIVEGPQDSFGGQKVPKCMPEKMPLFTIAKSLGLLTSKWKDKFYLP